MRAHVVLGHPETRSFNGLLAETTRSTLADAGWEVTTTDLGATGFDPREAAVHYGDRADPERFHAQTEQRFHAERGSTPDDVAIEVDHLEACDLLVVHFPLWWFGMPAVLKGWIDRTFVYGRMYTSTKRYDRGVCAGKRMLACVTTGASADSCAHDGREGDTRMMLWPVLFPFRYVGFEVLEPEVLHGIGGVSFLEGEDDGTSGVDRFTAHWVDQLTGLDDRVAVAYNRDDDFGDDKRLLPGAPTHSPFVAHGQSLPWTGRGPVD